MISALYAVLSALWLIKLSIDVIRLRMQYHISFGDGGFYELQTAVRLQGNAAEYLPIAILLLIMMEMNGAETWMIHLCGILMLIGRIIHYYALHHRDLKWRRSAMGATFTALLLMVLINLYFLPWEQILTFRQ